MSTLKQNTECIYIINFQYFYRLINFDLKDLRMCINEKSNYKTPTDHKSCPSKYSSFYFYLLQWDPCQRVLKISQPRNKFTMKFKICMVRLRGNADEAVALCIVINYLLISKFKKHSLVGFELGPHWVPCSLFFDIKSINIICHQFPNLQDSK